VRVGSAHPLLCEPTYLTDPEVSASLAAYVKGGGKAHRAFDGMWVYSRHDAAGWLSYAENQTRAMSFRVELDESGSFNVLPSRGSLNTMDALPPGRGQLLQVLTHGFADDGSRMSSSMRFQADYISSELHSPEVAGGVFSALKLHADSPDEQRGGVHSVVRGVEGGLHDMLSTLGFRFV